MASLVRVLAPSKTAFSSVAVTLTRGYNLGHFGAPKWAPKLGHFWSFFGPFWGLLRPFFGVIFGASKKGRSKALFGPKMGPFLGSQRGGGGWPGPLWGPRFGVRRAPLLALACAHVRRRARGAAGSAVLRAGVSRVCARGRARGADRREGRGRATRGALLACRARSAFSRACFPGPKKGANSGSFFI